MCQVLSMESNTSDLLRQGHTYGIQMDPQDLLKDDLLNSLGFENTVRLNELLYRWHRD